MLLRKGAGKRRQTSPSQLKKRPYQRLFGGWWPAVVLDGLDPSVYDMLKEAILAAECSNGSGNKVAAETTPCCPSATRRGARHIPTTRFDGPSERPAVELLLRTMKTKLHIGGFFKRVGVVRWGMGRWVGFACGDENHGTARGGSWGAKTPEPKTCPSSVVLRPWRD